MKKIKIVLVALTFLLLPTKSIFAADNFSPGMPSGPPINVYNIENTQRAPESITDRLASVLKSIFTLLTNKKSNKPTPVIDSPATNLAESAACENSGGKWHEYIKGRGPAYCDCEAGKTYNPINVGGDGACHENEYYFRECINSGGKMTILDSGRGNYNPISSSCSGEKASFGPKIVSPYINLPYGCLCPSDNCLDDKGACVAQKYPDSVQAKNCVDSGGTWGRREENYTEPVCVCPQGTAAILIPQGGDGKCKSDSELKQNCSSSGGIWRINSESFAIPAPIISSNTCDGSRGAVVNYPGDSTGGCICKKSQCLNGSGSCQDISSDVLKKNCEDSEGTWIFGYCLCPRSAQLTDSGYCQLPRE